MKFEEKGKQILIIVKDTSLFDCMRYLLCVSLVLALALPISVRISWSIAYIPGMGLLFLAAVAFFFIWAFLAPMLSEVYDAITLARERIVIDVHSKTLRKEWSRFFGGGSQTFQFKEVDCLVGHGWVDGKYTRERGWHFLLTRLDNGKNILKATATNDEAGEWGGKLRGLLWKSSPWNTGRYTC